MTATPVLIESKPYKGPNSFQVEDAKLFFGRELWSRQILAGVLGSRFTLLHAPSGAGKTSLLNARVIPALEARGWTPIRILPGDDPIESTRLAALRDLLPPPEAEHAALARARDALFPAEGEDPSLEQLLNRFDELPLMDDRRRALIQAFESSAPNADERPPFGLLTPMVCRILRASMDLHRFDQHLAAVGVPTDKDRAARDPIDHHTSVNAVLETLSRPAFIESYEELLTDVELSIAGLGPFFDRLLQRLAERGSPRRVLLIFDQFEELFTRFGDAGHIELDRVSTLLDWRLREEFFDEMQELYNATGPTAGGGEEEAAGAVPIRFVISLRDEYVASLDRIREFVWHLDDSAHHLPLMHKTEAIEAIREPAQLYGYGYSEECFGRMIEQLTKEEAFVEPTHLQIVCEKLWIAAGKELAKLSAVGADTGDTIPAEDSEASHDTIPLETFELLGETPGILSAFFTDFLSDLDPSDIHDTLEMLGQLVTSSGTRNIVEEHALIAAAFRDPAVRAQLLKLLVDHAIVRIEPRLGANFVEITHEFLIRPIRKAVNERLQEDESSKRLRGALHVLEGLSMRSSHDSTEQPMTQAEFDDLYRERDLITWNPASMLLMFRAAIWMGRDKETLRVWLGKMESGWDAQSLKRRLTEKASTTNWLTLEELDAVNRGRDDLHPTIEEFCLILGSTLKRATDEDRPHIAYWARRAASYDS